MEAEGGTAILKDPLAALCVATLVPFIVMVAFGSGEPSFESVTLPIIVRFCENETVVMRRRQSTNMHWLSNLNILV